MSKTGLLVLTVVVCIIAFFAQVLFALAQTPPQCADAEKIIGGLTGKYHESGILELMAENSKFQLFGNPETGTWSLLAFQPNGQSCIILGGTSIEPMARATKPKGGEL